MLLFVINVCPNPKSGDKVAPEVTIFQKRKEENPNILEGLDPVFDQKHIFPSVFCFVVGKSESRCRNREKLGQDNHLPGCFSP